MAEEMKLSPDPFLQCLRGFPDGLAELVFHDAGPKDINMLFRLPDTHREKEWLRVMEATLRSLNQEAGERAHVCKSYFIRKGRLVFGWNISLYPLDYEALAGKIAQACGVQPVEAAPVAEEAAPSSPRSAPAPSKPGSPAATTRGAVQGRKAPTRVGDTPASERGRLVDSIPLSGRHPGFDPDSGKGVQFSGDGGFHPLKSRKHVTRR
jgi:hypothetical protein